MNFHLMLPLPLMIVRKARSKLTKNDATVLLSEVWVGFLATGLSMLIPIVLRPNDYPGADE
jgi:hypothetical protein